MGYAILTGTDLKKNGTLTYVVGTNLTYRMPELLTRD